MHTCTPVALVTVETSSSGSLYAVVGEDRLSAAEDDRLDHQVQLVDQGLGEHGAYERRAPHDDEVTPIGLVQRSYARDGIRTGMRVVLFRVSSSSPSVADTT